MRAIKEASEIFELLAEPRAGRENFKTVLQRITCFINTIGREVGAIEAGNRIKANRINDIWSGEAKHVYSEEMDSFRAARAAKLGQRRACLIAEAIDARDQLLAELAAIERSLAVYAANRGREIPVPGRQEADRARLSHRPLAAAGE